MATDLKTGERVRVKDLVPVQVMDPFMQQYVGKEGAVIAAFRPGWDLARIYRVDFDDQSLETLNFFGKELERV